MFDYNYIHPGFIFIPYPNMTPCGLRAQYLIPHLMPKCEYLSIHSSLPSARATSARDPANPAQIVLLPNGNILPTAGTSTEPSEEIFPYRTGFVTKLGPQISLFPVPIFGVNSLFVLLLHHVLGVIKIGFLNKSCSKANLVPAHKNFRS
jgi:hypothetical protein